MLIQSTRELSVVKEKVSKCKSTLNTEIKYLKETLTKMGVNNYNFQPLEKEINKILTAISTSVENQINENAKQVGKKAATDIKKK
jgi:tetrahydromethanopterin S-methyltransferase subunit G